MFDDQLLSDETHNEACRIVGQCCLMLAMNGEETSREQLIYQLKRLHWQIMQETDVSNQAILLALEQLKGDG